MLGQGDLLDPFKADIVGRYLHGEEAQDPETFNKSGLTFSSGEALPKCWLNPDYRDGKT